MRREEGFSLIEVMVVVLVIAILIGIAIPTFLGYRHKAQRTKARQELVNAAKVESSYAAANGSGFTADAATLALLEPSLDWTGAKDESIHVIVADAGVVGDQGDVLLFMRDDGGEWQGIRLVASGASAGRYTCSGDKADVETAAACSAATW